MKTVAQSLKEFETEVLDISKMYLAIQSLSETDIRLFFKRNKQVLQNRVTPGLTLEQLGEIRDQIIGIAFIEMQFLTIKKEQKQVDNEH